MIKRRIDGFFADTKTGRIDWYNNMPASLPHLALRAFGVVAAQELYGTLDGQNSVVLNITCDTAANCAIASVLTLYDNNGNVLENLAFDTRTLNSGATASFKQKASSAVMNYARSYKLTVQSDTACNLYVSLNLIGGVDLRNNAKELEITSADTWYVVEGFNAVALTFDCTASGTTAGYVEVTVDKNEVDTGGTPSVEQWPLGTITNSVGHAEVAPVYAVRFVDTAGAGHKLLVRSV